MLYPVTFTQLQSLIRVPLKIVENKPEDNSTRQQSGCDKSHTVMKFYSHKILLLSKSLQTEVASQFNKISTTERFNNSSSQTPCTKERENESLDKLQDTK